MSEAVLLIQLLFGESDFQRLYGGFDFSPDNIGVGIIPSFPKVILHIGEFGRRRLRGEKLLRGIDADVDGLGELFALLFVQVGFQPGDQEKISQAKHHGEHSDQKLYPWEFDQLGLQPGMNALDLGCGYGLLWRQSWDRIPEGTQITLVDIYGKLLENIPEK